MTKTLVTGISADLPDSSSTAAAANLTIDEKQDTANCSSSSCSSSDNLSSSSSTSDSRPPSLISTMHANTVPSCLRSRKNPGMRRNVSFPDDESLIVTGILEPESPWEDTADITNDDLISLYMRSCEKHCTYPVPIILEQLSKLDLKLDRNESFSLKGIPLDANICETLEEVLKRVQFCLINLESTSLNDESAIALFDMLEYYESATKLNISSNPDIGVRGWQACSRLIKKTCCLEQLEASNTTISEVHMPILSRALKMATQLQILKLENCNLSGRPLITLATAMKANTTLKELYLPENDLGSADASQLGAMLKSNVTLQLLDISHNNITDAGMNTLMDSIAEQCFGLSVLIVWNNHLTRHIANSVSCLLEKFTGLEILNIGMNTLGDGFLRAIKLQLISNRNLLKLGMQSTYLSDEAAFIFADVLSRNTLLQRIDLRDNNIQISGLITLLNSLNQNSTLVRLDLDKVPRKSSAYIENHAIKYKNLVEEIRKKCAQNEAEQLERESRDNDEVDDQLQSLNETYKKLKLSFINSRKISLTCESLNFQRRSDDGNGIFLVNANGGGNLLADPTRKHSVRLRSPAPSPIPSPVSSPAPVRNTRFLVSKVSEKQQPCYPSNNRFSANAPSGSRFKIVTIVEPKSSADPFDTDDGDIDNGKQNVIDSTAAAIADDAGSGRVKNGSNVTDDNSTALDSADYEKVDAVNANDIIHGNYDDDDQMPPGKSYDDNSNYIVGDKFMSRSSCTESKRSAELKSGNVAAVAEVADTAAPPAIKITNEKPDVIAKEVKSEEVDGGSGVVIVSGTDATMFGGGSVDTRRKADDVANDDCNSKIRRAAVRESSSPSPFCTASDKPSTKDQQQIPITEKIRKLSWVSPIFQSSSSVIDTNKIPANLEKLLGLFQNPFAKAHPAKSSNVANTFREESVADRNHAQSAEPATTKHRNHNNNDVAFVDDRTNSSNGASNLTADNESCPCPKAGSLEDGSDANGNFKFFDLFSRHGSSQPEAETRNFPATWPQKLTGTTANFLCSPSSRSSPNILEATAFVLLQGHASDLTAVGIQNMSLAREENTTEQL